MPRVPSQCSHRGHTKFPSCMLWRHMGSAVYLGSMLENSGPRVSLGADHVGSLCWHGPEFQAAEGWAGGQHGPHRLHSAGRVSPSCQFTVRTLSTSRLPGKGWWWEQPSKGEWTRSRRDTLDLGRTWTSPCLEQGICEGLEGNTV